MTSGGLGNSGEIEMPVIYEEGKSDLQLPKRGPAKTSNLNSPTPSLRIPSVTEGTAHDC